jgi:hypothetical protein
MANLSQSVVELGYVSRSFVSNDAPFRDAVTLLGEMRWEEALGVWRRCYHCFQTSYLSKLVFVDLSIRLGSFDDAWKVIDSEECFASPNFPLRGIWRKAKEMWISWDKLRSNSQSTLDRQAIPTSSDPVEQNLTNTDLAALFELRRYDVIVSSIVRKQSMFRSDLDVLSIYLKSLFALGRYDNFLLEFKECLHFGSIPPGQTLPNSIITSELLDIKTRVDVRLQRRLDSIPAHVQRFKSSLAYKHTESMLLRCEDLAVQQAILNELEAFNRVVGVFGDGFRLYSV